jgi:putative ABC transport system permease protein
METLEQDFHYAVRTMRKSPAFTLLVVLTLALGIGVNATVCSMVASVLFAQLPGEKPHELVRLYSGEKKDAGVHDAIALPIYKEYRTNLKSITLLSAYRDVSLNFAQNNETAERLTAAVVTGDFFDAVGLYPRYGRLFSSDDDGPIGSNPVAILSERFWRREFDGRPDVIGTWVKINGQRFTIIGVAPSALQQFDRDAQLWLPMSMAIQAEPMFATQIDRMTNPFFNVIGRMRPGTTIAQAQQELDALSTHSGAGQIIRLRESMTGEALVTSNGAAPDPDSEEVEWQRPWITLEPAKKNVGSEEVRLSWLLMGVVALVLLIACADVAGLLLARAESEQREAGIRIALGASSWDLYRQRLVQGALFSIFGAAAGLLLAWWAQLLILAAAPADSSLPIGFASSVLDARIVLFVLAVSVFTGIVLTLLSGARCSAINLSEILKRQPVGFRTNSARGTPIQTFLIVFQVACAVVLLIGAGLLIRTLHNVARIDLGFDAERVLSASLDLSKQGYDKSRSAAFLEPLRQQANVIPGVQSAALRGGTLIAKQRQGSSAKARDVSCSNLPLNMISADYFRTLGIAFLRGRDFSPSDSQDGAGVAIVNQAAAELCWPDKNAVGQYLPHLATLAKPFEIIGIVGNVSDEQLQPKRRPQIYVSLPQFYQAFPFQTPLSILVRTSLPPHALVRELNSSIQQLDGNFALYNISTPREELADAFSRERFLSQLLSGFGMLAMLLAVAGLYGMLAYLTARRTHEFGVRMAIGAQPRDILSLVMVQGARLTLVGVVVGLGAAIACTRYIQTLLYGVKPNDMNTFVTVAVFFLGVALLACYFPARRATRIDPVVALRDE